MADSRLDDTLERIEQLTAQLERGIGDPITMRAVLDEYLSALEQLRAGVRAAERRLSSVAETVSEGKKLIRKERKSSKSPT